MQVAHAFAFNQGRACDVVGYGQPFAFDSHIERPQSLKDPALLLANVGDNRYLHIGKCLAAGFACLVAVQDVHE